MKVINNKMNIAADDSACLAECMRFIDSNLESAGVSSRLAITTQLLSEEMIVALLENAASDARVRVQARRILGDTSITISVPGDKFDIYDDEPAHLEDTEDEEVQAVIRSIILRSHGEKLKFSHRNGVNRVRIMSGQSERNTMHYTIAAMLLGLVFGIAMMFAPESIAGPVSAWALTPIRTMFMNALKIVIAPVVFFSIVSCISQFKNLSELGRIGARVMGMYLLTTVFAICIAAGISHLLDPGSFGAALQGGMQSQSVDVDTNVDTSLISTIVNIIPANFVRPFLEANTLQIIFLAVLCGFAVGMIGDYSETLRSLFEAFNSLFLTITSIIARFIPIAVFCSVALMLTELGGSSLLSVLSVFGTHVTAIICMLIVYGILVLVLGRLDPRFFYRKDREGMLTSFTLSSSSAAMPTNLRICTDKLGISPKVCSFSIPLGATINMDGACIFLTVFSLYLAKMYGITVSGSMLLSMGLTIILLSLGCPGVPGSGLVCLGIVLSQLGVPVEAIGLVIAINPFVDMLDTLSNTTGDVAAALITARREGLLDLDVYYDRK